jgi:hypothetical protein
MTNRAWYVVAAVALLAGAAGAVMLILSGVSGLAGGMTRVVVPGSSVLTLAEPGSYTIYHETESVIDGRVYSSDNVNGLRISITDVASGTAIQATTPAGTERYSVGGHTGVSLLAFDIVHPGQYRFDASYDGGRTEPAAVLAIGQGFVGRLLMTIFGAIGAAFAGFVIALVLALVTFFNRRRMRRAAAASGPILR